MKEFEVINDDVKIKYSFPTSIDEIDSAYLAAITNNIAVAAHHVLVGIVYREKISSIVMTYKQKKKGFNAGVTPIFIKAGGTDSSFINQLEIKDKLVIPSSMLQLGNHVSISKNELSIDRFIGYIDKDAEAGKRAILANFPACFVDFKIVAVADIVGAYKKDSSIPRKYTSIEPIEDK